ncbi:MAG: 2,4-dienoyl-CoA reductase (NADPH2) [Halioglobus sp.]|jgi:2,4-dienoyl-CoA reductase (NADPH2)
MQLKNRMVMSPMTTAYCNDDQTPNERLIGHFEERAKGGIGLITVELTTVDEVHRYMHRSMTLADDKYIDHHRRLTDAIHQHGCKVQPQISHSGPESVSPMFGGPQTVGPSVNVAPVWGWPSRELSVEELPAIAIQYGEAVRRAREAGYDGIELHAAHCYNLLGSFLSPLRNKRTDEYAAFKADTKIQFITEVLAQVQARAGADFPVTLSVSGFERTPGGRAIDDTQRLAPALVAAGVDCFRVSGGISDILVTMMVNGSGQGNGVNAAQAEAIKNVVDVPVMAVGRIHTPELAESIIEKGQADLVAMARPLLADPYFAYKVASGKSETIRRCISCENCIDSMAVQDNLRCAINPLSGRETELKFNATNKKVVIVGAGTAGLEAARLASEAGHRVVLFERQKSLGGSLVLASTVHSDNETFLNWLLAEVRRLPIDIRTGIEVTADVVQLDNPDAVIVATGAVVSVPQIPGADDPQVISGALMRQLVNGQVDEEHGAGVPKWFGFLANNIMPLVQPHLSPGIMRFASRYWLPLGKEIVIVGADLVAIELAEFLANRGRRVHVLETANKIAPEVGKKRRQEHMDRLDRLQVTINTSVNILKIERDKVVIEVAGGQRSIRGDNIIIAGNPVAATELADSLQNSLQDKGIDVYAVGDCTGLGLIAKATHSAAEAVSQL